MEKVAVILIWLALVLTLSTQVMGGKDECATIQDGTLVTSDGEVIVLGYDDFGYNYQAHLFNGRYCDYDRVEGGDYCDVNLIMKWHDAWVSNKDCDGDSLLDRHFGYDSHIGSGAWCTNHMSGAYFDMDILCQDCCCPSGCNTGWRCLV